MLMNISLWVEVVVCATTKLSFDKGSRMVVLFSVVCIRENSLSQAWKKTIGLRVVVKLISFE